jgi:cytochrome b
MAGLQSSLYVFYIPLILVNDWSVLVASTSGAGEEKRPVKAWDIGVRAFHWLLVVLVVNAWVTAEWGDMEMRWHKWNGYAIFFILAFRLAWGFLGGHTARFINFIYGPVKIFAYARGLLARKPPKYLGHNPLGALMVLLMLVVLLAQVASGLFSSDGLFAYGPLSGLVSESRAEDFALIHEWGFYLVLLLVVMHVGAIMIYQFVLRENLIKPMFTGKKDDQDYLDASQQTKVMLLRLLLCVSVSAFIVLFVVSGFDFSELQGVLFD